LCIVVGLAIGLVWPRNRRLARTWLVFVAVLYFVLALPVTAKVIADALPSTVSLDADRAGPLDAIVVFDGDNRRGRVTATARAFWTSHPSAVLVLGGQAEWLYDRLPKAGLPAQVCRLDSGPRTTRDQIAWVRTYLASHDERIAVVASRLQVPRIARLLEVAKVNVALIRAPIDQEPPTNGWRLFVPRYIALRVSRDALYEHLALAYYHYNGWTTP
jgi:uncharacterized SAM-binding protein YcdF (DUF218 family)